MELDIAGPGYGNSTLNADPSADSAATSGSSANSTGESHDGDPECSEPTTDATSVDILLDDVFSKAFDSIDDAECWYKKYARTVGFGVRRDRYGRTVKGEVIWRSWVCDREGFRAKKHFLNIGNNKRKQDLTRFGCGTNFRVRLNVSTNKWGIDKFEETHTGHMVVGPKFSYLFPSHRSLSTADISQANSMRSCGITTAHIMGFMVHVAGGHDTCGFVRKDLYNHFDRERRAKIRDRDVVAALCYLQAKADTDPLSFVRYTTDSDNRLQHLFWCDGQSRVDFQCFYDVISFDTTYKKNLYNKPLVIFSGLNHHAQNIVFAAAILADETEPTYKWVLQTFIDAMEGRHPKAIVTDGDKAMRKAIKALLPQAVHRLCSWHLAHNACSNVSNTEFQQAFADCMYSNISVSRFEEKLRHVVEQFNLVGNSWVEKTYKKRRLWATAYLRDKFFAGIRTTSRCESLNSFIAGFVRSRDTLVDMLHHYERDLLELRNNEFVEDFRCLTYQPVLDSPLRVLEEQAAQIYTRKAFLEFHEQVVLSGDLTFVHRTELLSHTIYRIGKFLHAGSEWQVLFDRDRETLCCECHLLQSRGFPCCHILCAMKHEHLNHLPPSLICARWTRTAKTEAGTSRSSDDSAQGILLLRFGSLRASCNWMSHLACQDDHDYNEIRTKVAELIQTLEGRQRGRLGGRGSNAAPAVADPVNVRSKGRPLQPKNKARRQNKCAICKVAGHNRSTCPLLHRNSVTDLGATESQASQCAAPCGPISGEEEDADCRWGPRRSTSVHDHPLPTSDSAFVDWLGMAPWFGTHHTLNPNAGLEH